MLVALDFDGTLAPITPHPEDARPLPGVHRVLRDVRATGAALAVVTGRSVSSLLRVSGFGAIPGIVIYGTHGAERWQEGSLRAAAGTPGLEELRESLPGLVAGLVRDPDVWVEDKSLSLVVHARLTAQPERVLERLRGPVEEAAAAAGLGVRPGREVLEICLPGIDKGTAIRALLAEDRAAVLYAGDDVGDLDAMMEVNAWAERVGRPGFTVAVGTAGGPLAGAADVTVPDPQGLLDLLRDLFLAAFAPGRGLPRVACSWVRLLAVGRFRVRLLAVGRFRVRRGHQSQDGGADGAVDHGRDLGFGPLGAVVPLGEHADPGQPDLG